MEYLNNNNIKDIKNLKKDIIDAYLINTEDGINHVGGTKKDKKEKKNSKTNSKNSNINKKKEKFEKKTKTNYLPRNIYQNLKFKLEPIKIILKYKNSNRKNQYETYIFVGTIGKRYDSIFSRIEKLNLYETLKEITIDEEKSLVNGFGDFWMTKFFNIYHISEFVNKIEQNSKIKSVLIDKYNDIWLQNFINKFKNDIVFKKVYYSYSDLIKFQYKVKMGKKLEKIEIEKEDVEELNFKIQEKTKNILYNKPNISDKNHNQIGGELDDLTDGNLSEEEQNISDVVDMYDTIEENNIESSEDELNLEEIEKIYQQDEVDSNLKNTTDLISNILEDDKILENKEIYMCAFSEERDNNLEHQTLEDAYTKKFVYNHYIYKDDTIKTVKNKITCSIMNNMKFGKQNYIIPSRMYLWSEYIINEKIEKIMIGQRWLKKNELLNIDIEPLQISKYENLDGQIKILRDTLKRYGGKIRREDEDTNILYDYENYIANDEIYMCDIYNELGDKYTGNMEKISNLTDTYFKIYFPKIKFEDIKGIIDYLLGDTKVEDTRIKNTFDTLYNDLIIEKEITDLIEITKIDESDEYTHVFESGNFITQSVIHVNLEIYDKQLEEENKENINKLNKLTGEFGAVLLPKLDLFRIFNDFTPTDRYPFIQYQMTDGQIIFKYFDEYMYEFSKTKDNVDMITKWFENSPYGISFKVKLHDNKFMAINVNEIGKIEYKTQWKEEDGANINNVINTYSYVKDLVGKINETLINHPRKIYVRVPEDWEFRFAFINCIQKFKLPNNKIIDHNDLSDFASCFFPYIALVIEPRKRISKLSSKEEKSKYGSYLRYKRVTKFENAGRIEQRILSYIRNFDFEDDILIDEISKQFNITPEKAKEEITKVRTQFPNIGKVKKPIKKMDSIPKFKPPGIGIDIQGRTKTIRKNHNFYEYSYLFICRNIYS